MKKFLLTKKMLLQAGNNDFHFDNKDGNVDVIDDDNVDYKELGRVPCKTPTQPSLHIVHDQLSDIGPFDLLLILSELGRNVDKASYPGVPHGHISGLSGKIGTPVLVVGTADVHAFQKYCEVLLHSVVIIQAHIV